MKREGLLLLAFFLVVGIGFAAITLSITKSFVNNINSTTANYFPDGNSGVGEQ